MAEAMASAQAARSARCSASCRMFSGGNLSQRHASSAWASCRTSRRRSSSSSSPAVYPPLEKLQKEGESGRKKINEYTRYATVPICMFQAFIVRAVHHEVAEPKAAWGWRSPATTTMLDFYWYGFTAVLTMTAGTVFLMWLGEQIDEYGIGNGISLIIMAGIVARIPDATSALLFDSDHRQAQGVALHPRRRRPATSASRSSSCWSFLFVAWWSAVIAITKAQRRIPTQSAKHVRGRRVYGGTRQFLPLKVNQAGVMPVIFASSLLMLPVLPVQRHRPASPTGAGPVARRTPSSARATSTTCCYIVLIYFFCYFWTAIIFNPKDMANNLKDYGSFIPGYRPGKRTADYLERVLMRITYVGAAFLAVDRGHPERDLQPTLDIDPIGRQLLRRHRPADRHQRGPRPGAEDQQPPGHAELPGLDRGLIRSNAARAVTRELPESFVTGIARTCRMMVPSMSTAASRLSALARRASHATDPSSAPRQRQRHPGQAAARAPAADAHRHRRHPPRGHPSEARRVGQLAEPLHPQAAARSRRPRQRPGRRAVPPAPTGRRGSSWTATRARWPRRVAFDGCCGKQ